jgi:hypothetical protein
VGNAVGVSGIILLVGFIMWRVDAISSKASDILSVLRGIRDELRKEDDDG